MSMTQSHYDEVLQEARQKGELIANKYIFELYTILRDEEDLQPEDCRAKIEQDCIDLWSKATIRKFLPEEAKNQKKSKAGKIRAQQKKKLEEEEKLKAPQLIEQTTDGNIITTAATDSSGSSGARINLAENRPFGQEEEESRRFHRELSQQLAERTPSPELIEAAKIISAKDQRIMELEGLTMSNSNWQINSELYLPAKIAGQIHDIINISKAASMSETDFILRHDGSQIIAVESLNGDYYSSAGKMTHDDTGNARSI
jgi:hypothetical protein